MIARMVGGRSENMLYRVTTIRGSFSNTCKARGIYLSDSWNANPCSFAWNLCQFWHSCIHTHILYIVFMQNAGLELQNRCLWTVGVHFKGLISATCVCAIICSTIMSAQLCLWHLHNHSCLDSLCLIITCLHTVKTWQINDVVVFCGSACLYTCVACRRRHFI